MTGPRWWFFGTHPKSGAVTMLAEGTPKLGESHARVLAHLLADDTRLRVTTYAPKGKGPLGNPTLAAHGMARAATWHILSEDNEPLADLYYNLSKRPAAARVARLIANLIGGPVKLLDNAGTPPDLKAHPRSYVSNPAQVPQGGVYAYWRDHGRVWVESIHSLNGTAMIRPAGEGMRGHVKKVALRDLDFGEVGSSGWRPLANPKRLFPGMSSEASLRDAGYKPCPLCGGAGVTNEEGTGPPLYNAGPECSVCHGEGWIQGNPPRSKRARAYRAVGREWYGSRRVRRSAARKFTPGGLARLHYAEDSARARRITRDTGNLIRRRTNPALPFDAWMRAVDAAVEAKAGLSVHDLADCPFMDWYESRVTPKSAASRAIRSQRENPRGGAAWKFTGRGQGGRKVIVTVERLPIIGTPMQASSSGGFGQLHYATTSAGPGVGIVLITGRGLEGWAVPPGPSYDKEFALGELRRMRQNPRKVRRTWLDQWAEWELRGSGGREQAHARFMAKVADFPVVGSLRTELDAEAPKAWARASGKAEFGAACEGRVANPRAPMDQHTLAATLLDQTLGPATEATQKRGPYGPALLKARNDVAAWLDGKRKRFPTKAIYVLTGAANEFHYRSPQSNPKGHKGAGVVLELFQDGEPLPDLITGATLKAALYATLDSLGASVGGKISDLTVYRDGRELPDHVLGSTIEKALIAALASLGVEVFPRHEPNPKARNRWTVRDASGRIFWNGNATDESEALFMAERSQAGKSDPPEPWTATRSNPSYRLTGTLEEIPDAPAVRRGPGRPRRVALAPVEPEAPPPAVAEIPFEVPGEAAPRRDFQPGEHVTVPYSGRSSYFGRKVRRTRERGIVEGYVRQGGEMLVHVRVARGGQVEDHHFPERDVRRLPRSGQKVLSIRRPAVRARLERKVRGSLDAAEKMIAKLSAQFEAADARAHEIYPQFGQLPSKEYVNLRARMRRLREKLDVLGVLAGELGGGLAATGTDPWAANRRQSNPSWPAIDHSLLSPSGRMSKRARSAAMKREAARLFPPGYWDPPPQSAGDKAAAQAAVLLRTAAQLRELAARGMQPRKYVKAAERLERQAAEAVRRTPNQRRHKHGAIGGSRTVRGVNRKGNPRGSEYDRAVQTYRMWHEFEPHRITRMKGPDRLIPRTLVKLGEIRAIDYISDKYKGRPVTYTHKTDRPRPVLATDPDGRNLHIVGGRVQITADGLIH